MKHNVSERPEVSFTHLGLSVLFVENWNLPYFNLFRRRFLVFSSYFSCWISLFQFLESV
jgi:hypothetical protein